MKHAIAVLLFFTLTESYSPDLTDRSLPNVENDIDPRLLNHLRSYRFLPQKAPYQYYRHISKAAIPRYQQTRLEDLLKEFNTIRLEKPEEGLFLGKDVTKKQEHNQKLLQPLQASESKVNKFSMLGTSKLVAPDGQRSEIQISSAEQYVRPFLRNLGQAGDVYFVAIVAGCSAVAIFGVIGAGYCFYKFQQHNKAAADVDYPAYGVVGPAAKEASNTNGLSPSGDRKLAQSAQMYHYHHQKQQMIASEKAVTSRHTSASDVDSDEENEEGDYTVYECPGLAPTGEMEVKNPLFQDDVTPVSSPAVASNNTKEK